MSEEKKIEPVLVFVGSDINAHIALNSLQANGITAQVIDQHIGTIAPWHLGGGGLHGVKVVVPSNELDAARTVLESSARTQDKPPSSE